MLVVPPFRNENYHVRAACFDIFVSDTEQFVGSIVFLHDQLGAQTEI